MKKIICILNINFNSVKQSKKPTKNIISNYINNNGWGQYVGLDLENID